MNQEESMSDPTPSDDAGQRPAGKDAASVGDRAPVPPGECLRCGNPIASIGIEQLRVGGTAGGWKLLFGEWAELGEGMIAVEVFVCSACGHLELRSPANDR
jgi:hypothetical protein